MLWRYGSFKKHYKDTVVFKYIVGSEQSKSRRKQVTLGRDFGVLLGDPGTKEMGLVGKIT